MSGVNKAILIGYLGADPELRYTPKGDPVLRFRVAVTETWRDMSGAKRERTEWLSCVLWGKRGEALSAHLSRGSRVYIEGKIQTRKWQDRDGNDRYTTEINVQDVALLGAGRHAGERTELSRSERRDHEVQRGGSYDSDGEYPSDDEIPF